MTNTAYQFARLLTPVRRGIDGMKMTALSAWAVDTLSKDGADAVALEWAFGTPRIEISATYLDGRRYSAVGAGRRDNAVMGAVADIIDERAASLTANPRWHEVLGVPETASLAEAETAYKALVKASHPDLGGDPEIMVRINVARDAVRAERLAA